MKKGWLYSLLGIFLCLLTLGGVTINSIYRIQRHGSLINYTGIVRGASQKLIKMELNDIQGDDLIFYIDEILDSLTEGSGVYDLPLPDDENYQSKLGKTKEAWEQIKKQIYITRKDSGNMAAKNQLLQDSEQFFNTTNDMVFAAESFTNQHARRLMLLDIIMFACVLALWIFIFITNIRKILRLETSNRELKDTAGRDSLTRAYTLEYFISQAQELMKQQTELNYALFYVDFSDFKYINDVFGYARGDDMLRQYAALLIEDKKAYELVGRINADNFIILRHYENRTELTKRQSAVDARIREYMRSHLEKQSLSICCGICCMEDVDEKLSLHELLNRANFARKMVKDGHELNNYCFYDESIRQHLLEEKSIESGMEEALKNHQFLVYYQPKIDVQTGEIAGAEALVRWRIKKGTLLMPDQFIPVFEKNRTIPLLDQYVFECVCAWQRRLLDEGRMVLPVSVNVSRLQFCNADFVETYAAIKKRYQLPAGLLEIEFTESVLYDNWERLTSIVDELHAAGFTCSIDDFGKGYSSLGMFKNLNVDVLKIDALFFQQLEQEEKDQLLVNSIIQLVRQFGVKTVAEGIETQKQVDILKEMHCDYIQGYVYYKPLPQKGYERLLLQSSPQTVKEIMEACVI